MPVTLLLIKLEKQSLYHWKANKHAHITIIKLKHKNVNKNVVFFKLDLLPQIPKNVSSDFANIFYTTSYTIAEDI